MKSDVGLAPRVIFFLAGVAAGALTGMGRSRRETSPNADDWKQAVADLEARVIAREAASARRFEAVETRLLDHSQKLADLPSTRQIVAAMEQLLSKTMATLDERLTTQAHSIELLKTTVSQTDNLLERVLESIDSLQSYGDSPENTDDTIVRRPAV